MRTHRKLTSHERDKIAYWYAVGHSGVSKTFLFDTNLSRLTIGDQCVLFESYAELKA
jgi:hypothetical protein